MTHCANAADEKAKLPDVILAGGRKTETPSVTVPSVGLEDRRYLHARVRPYS